MMPSAVSPMLLNACSSVTSACAMTLVFRGSMPRSARALAIAGDCEPPGTKTKIASGFMSLARCTKAEKSGLLTGYRTGADDLPAGRLERALEGRFGVVAGGKVRNHRVDLAHAVLV